MYKVQIDDVVRDATAEEAAAIEAAYKDAANKEAAMNAAAKAKESALAKLVALGLTEAEIAALVA